MITVGLAELKNRLSAYVDKVREGERVLVLDRGEPVAELRPPLLPDDQALAGLIRAGVVSPPTAALPDDFLTRPLPRTVDGASVVEALLAERDEAPW